MNVFDRLDEEWEALRRSGPMTRALRRWGEEDPVLRFPDLETLTWAVERRDVSADVNDRILAALARRAPSDSDAARVLLQLLLPGCKALVKRYRVGERTERAGLIIGWATDRIRTYPIDRRPEKIAANVLLDVRQRLLRDAMAVSRRQDVSIARVHERHLPYEADVLPPAAEAIAVLGWAVRSGHLDQESARLIALTRLAGISVASLAEAQGESEQTLRRRRLRAERRVRALALA